MQIRSAFDHVELFLAANARHHAVVFDADVDGAAVRIRKGYQRFRNLPLAIHPEFKLPRLALPLPNFLHRIHTARMYNLLLRIFNVMAFLSEFKSFALKRNALHLREEGKKPAAKADPNTQLLEEIRDLLRSKG